MTVEEATPAGLVESATPRELDWNAVYRDQLPRLYNYFRFRTGRDADVEDLTARTFEKAWKARDRYRRDLSGFSTWLFSIARNVAIDYMRARQRHLPLEAARDVATASTPEEDAAKRSDIQRLTQLTVHLSDRAQELIALKYGAALNNRMIARITGLSESNVGTVLQRTVDKLRSQW
jgi:RNA polymerase sigma-70 factor, ECF subfamily